MRRKLCTYSFVMSLSISIYHFISTQFQYNDNSYIENPEIKRNNGNGAWHALMKNDCHVRRIFRKKFNAQTESKTFQIFTNISRINIQQCVQRPPYRKGN